MGQASSSTTPQTFDHRAVTARLNKIVSDVVASGTNDISSMDKCMSSFNVVVKKELLSMPKMHLKELNDNVYFVKDVVAVHGQKGAMVTKKHLCEKITAHYAIAAATVSTLRAVYDMENSGERSFWSHVLKRNFILDGKKIVAVKEHPRTDPPLLPGVEAFVAFLSKESEKRTFALHLNWLTSPGGHGNIDHSMVSCGDELFSGAQYDREVYPRHDVSMLVAPTAAERKRSSTASCRRYKEIIHADPSSSSSSSSSFAGGGQKSKRRKNGTLVVDDETAPRRLSLVTAEPKARSKAMQVYNSMVRRVAGNLRRVHGILEEIVSPKTGEFRQMDAKTLDGIVLRTKQTIASYYMGILYDCSVMVDALSTRPTSSSIAKKMEK